MSFILARAASQSIPRTLEKPVAAGQSWLQGALLIVDANGAYTECGADPAAIAAVALSGYGTDTSGFVPLGTKSFPPGYCQGTSVNGTRWRANYVGTLPAATGGNYGVVRDTDGRWKVDFTDTTATRVKLVSREATNSPNNQAWVEVEFLAANVQVM